VGVGEMWMDWRDLVRWFFTVWAVLVTLGFLIALIAKLVGI